jgi:hypothetical protein
MYHIINISGVGQACQNTTFELPGNWWIGQVGSLKATRHGEMIPIQHQIRLRALGPEIGVEMMACHVSHTASLAFYDAL